MTRPFAIDLAWAGLLGDIGIAPDDLLRAADLPADLFRRERPVLEPDAFFRLWEALVALLDSPTPGLLIGQAIRSNAFNAPLFAAFCSPNLKLAFERLAVFKPLLGPYALDLRNEKEALSISYSATHGVHLPSEFVAAELVLLVSLGRMATRTHMTPLKVEMVEPPAPGPYDDFFGVRVGSGAGNRLLFSQRDAARPFLSVNPAMYALFEPALRTRLADLDADTAITDKLRAALMEALPSGRSRIEDIAPRLGFSVRSLQRKLSEADTSYQAELASLRARLATEYLRNTAQTSAEISYLLGYEDPNSFIRAFQSWTGTTPEALRKTVLQ